VRDNKGMNPLQTAVAMGDAAGTAVTRVLLEGGADVGVLDDEGCTVLHSAATYGFAKIMEVLVEHKAPLDSAENEGFTPIVYAVAAGRAQCVSTLLLAGADPEISDAYERTPLHFAAAEGRADVIDALCNGNIQMSTQDADGDTPLHAAALTGDAASFRTLLACGSDPRVANNDGDMPAHIAAENGHAGVVQALIDYEADMDVMNNQELTPLGCARLNQHKEVADLINQNYRQLRPAEMAQSRVKRPELSLREWKQRQKAAKRVVALNGWEAYADADTGAQFYLDTSVAEQRHQFVPEDGAGRVVETETHGFTWEEPIELGALVGPPWEQVRGTLTTLQHTKRLGRAKVRGTLTTLQHTNGLGTGVEPGARHCSN
jgi:ankyrin repeat protein